MAHGGEPGADPAHAQAIGRGNLETEHPEVMYERLLKEERERTTVMTLANNHKRQELRTLRTQNADLLVALKQQHEALAPNKKLPHVLCGICDIIEAAS